ncbi:MAG: VWA domain-containing protein [Acidobacteriaceae bacterium]|nr:VWA domain-containing protein [Acidobacteriaceae bacterium]
MRAILFIVAGCALAVAQQGEPPLFKGGVADVQVSTQVLLKDRAVDSLTREDFEVFDNQQLRPLVDFSRERTPLTLLLLLDRSGSMNKYLEQLNRASAAALAQLQPGDTVGVMVFSREARPTLPFTTDRAAAVQGLRDAVRERDLGSGTLINPALLAAAAHLRAQAPPGGTRAIVIVTDNLGLNYQSPDAAAVRALHDANTGLHAIVVGQGRRPDGTRSRFANPDFSPANVFHIAEETGGDALRADRVDEVFPRLIERIRSRYQLVYRAPEGTPGEFREIRVSLTPAARVRFPGAEVRSRRGYFVQQP